MLDWGGSGISQGLTKPWWRYLVCRMHGSISGVCSWDLFIFWKVLYIQQWSTSAKKIFRNTHLWPYFYCIWCEITRFKRLVIDSNSWLVPVFLFFSPLNLQCKHTHLLQMYKRARVCMYIHKSVCRGLLKGMHAHTQYAL